MSREYRRSYHGESPYADGAETTDNTATGGAPGCSSSEGQGPAVGNMRRKPKRGALNFRPTWLRRIVLVPVATVAFAFVGVAILCLALFQAARDAASGFMDDLRMRAGRRDRQILFVGLLWIWDREFVSNPDAALARARKRVCG